MQIPAIPLQLQLQPQPLPRQPVPVTSPTLTATEAGELPLAIFAFHYLPQNGNSAPSYGTGWQSLRNSPNTYYASETQVGTATTGAGSLQTGYYLSQQDASNNTVESAAILIQGNSTTQTTTTAAQQNSIVLGSPLGGTMFATSLPNLSPQNLGLTSIDLSSANSANSAITSADSALATIDGQQTSISSLQLWLQTLASSNSMTSLNINQAASSLQDAPVTQDLETYTRAKLLNGVNTSLLANTDSLAKGILSLLGSGTNSQSTGSSFQAASGNSKSISSKTSYQYQ